MRKKREIKPLRQQPEMRLGRRVNKHRLLSPQPGERDKHNYQISKFENSSSSSKELEYLKYGQQPNNLAILSKI